MSRIVVVSGNPRPGSRTSTLAVAVGEAVAARTGGLPPTVIEVGELGPGLLTPGDEATAAAVSLLREAEVLVVATPTYKGSYTGVLKVLLDQLPAQALAGKRAVPVVTAGVAPQAGAAEALLRQLLTELGADVAPGLPVVEADLPETKEIAERYAERYAGTAHSGHSGR
ncbi:NADPH-dependent FMN reductase [Actinoplanes sp. CA-030573]|uniref:NADPH-dependent FMN reductase n=1 Tax=Actinoplanes sp. CA-030573 TaxID=3239898 RepID=UPI003D8F1426